MKYLKAGALFFYPCLAACVVLQPSAVMSHYGFSYYGNMQATVVPFCVGLLATAYCLRCAALSMAVDSLNQLRRLATGLKLIALSMVGVVITPSLSGIPSLQVAHMLFGIIVFAGAAVISLAYAVWIRDGLHDWLLAACQVLALIVAGLSFDFLGTFELMLPAQLVAASAFGVLLLRSVGYALAQRGEAAHVDL